MLQLARGGMEIGIIARDAQGYVGVYRDFREWISRVNSTCRGTYVPQLARSRPAQTAGPEAYSQHR